MRFSRKAMLATAMAVSVGSTALAATAPMLGADGRTIAGPGNVVVPKTTMATLMSNYFGNDACVTVINLGPTDFTLDTAGTGTGSIVVAARESASLCQAALTTVTLTCSGAQAGDCRAAWRVDR